MSNEHPDEERRHGSFADGEAESEHDQEREFSEGQEAGDTEHHHGRFSEGQEELGEDDPEKHVEGSFGTGQEEDG